MLRDRRLGRFIVNRDFINEIPQAVKSILKGVLIVRADISFATDSFVYEGICDDFAPADLNFESPYYVRDIDPAGNVTCRKVGFEPNWVDNRSLMGWWAAECETRRRAATPAKATTDAG